ncbi:MAG: hypothetical protein J0M16_00155 [Gammaproteobacteria bacterium]|nr:hypothetical protein [Gammaproteobacteria bacterium]
MQERRSIALLTMAAYVLALGSVFTTRVVKAFTLAEVLAVATFVCGLAVFVIYRRERSARPLAWPHRLVVVGSVIGLAGLALKVVFSLLGIGAGEHDMANHATAAGNPLLVHIHHLFFNLGFLFLLVSAIILVGARVRGGHRHVAT